MLLDGFHALKHALRFGAEVPVAVTADRAGALALAEELAPDVRRGRSLAEVPQETYASRAAPASHRRGRPGRAGPRAANLRGAGAQAPPYARHVALDQPRNLGNAGR